MKNPCFPIARSLAPRAGSAKRLAGAFLFFLFAFFSLHAALHAATFASLYEQGLKALEAGQYVKARELLAQAIRLDPDQPGAWLDLAIAARAEGDAAFADDILQMMTERFGIPAHLAGLVGRFREDLNRSLLRGEHIDDSWGMRSRFSVALGHDSNANGGLSISALALTFPEGSFTFPIAPALQKRSDQFLASNLLLSGRRRFNGGTLEPMLRVRLRENFSVSDFNTQEFGAGIGWVLPQSAADLKTPIPQATRFSAASQNVRLGGRGLLISNQIGAEHQWAGSRCAPGAGISLDDRTFPIQGNLDSRLWWASGRLVCLTDWGRLPGRIQLQLRSGLERAKQSPDPFSSSGRTGGDTRHLETSALYIQQAPAWLGAGRLEAEAVFVQTQDTDGYSVLLENNARRSIYRSTLSLAYSLPISGLFAGPSAPQAEFNLIWQAFQQRSNLEIFRTDGQQISAGVSFFW